MKPTLQYMAIEDALSGAIERAELVQGDRLPSENQLALDYGVSRMTARRALQELVSKGLAYRQQGRGTFVANLGAIGSSIEITNISDEVAGRQGKFSSSLQEQCMRNLPPHLAQFWPEAVQSLAFVSLVHYENSVPIQWEQRYVCEHLSQAFLVQDFSVQTPSEFLSKQAPLTQASSRISAVNATEEIAQNLGLDVGAACLKIDRVTVSNQQTISIVELIYPGSRYSLNADFYK